MADLEAIEVLTQAKERLFEYGWAQGTAETRSHTSALCLEEALCGQRGTYLQCEVVSAKYGDHGSITRLRASDYVREAIGAWRLPAWHSPVADDGSPEPLWRWNDRVAQSAGEIFDTIDRAIEIAKEASNPALS